MKKIIFAGALLSFAVLAACGKQSPVSTSHSSSSSSTPPSHALEVVVNSPVAGSIVKSPLLVLGKAPGTWFFEGSLPVVLQDDAGNVLASGPAKAEGEWMTTDFVDFSTELTFTTSAKKGRLIIKKDNPSGDLAHDASVSIPVSF